MTEDAPPEPGVQLATIRCWAAGLDALHARIAHRFRRAEVRARARRYLAGLLGRAERKNGWQLAEETGERHPRGVQRLLDAARWDADAVRDDLRAYVVEHLGDERAVLVVDETGFLKKGTKSVGVARQYSGTAGRTENSQVGVFLVYAAPRGRAFLDRAVYLPAAWAADGPRRAEAGVPPAVPFATKPQLARAMLQRAFAAGVPATWVVGDTVYGTGRGMRPWLEAERRAYVLAVPARHRVWVGRQLASARAAVGRLPQEAWARRSAGEGRRGPRWFDWTWLSVAGTATPGWGHWLLARRSVSDPADVAYYRVFAPAGTPLEDAARAAGSRWAVEVAFEQAKGEVGLDQYEVRRWEAWHRHVTLALLAHAYLEITRLTAEDPAGRKKGGRAADALVPLTAPEVRRLLRLLAVPAAERRFRLAWSRWRRAHQAGARHRPRGAPAPAVSSPPIPTPGPRAVPPPAAPAPPPVALTDAQWARVASLLPVRDRRRGGRPPRDPRPIVAALLWLARTGAAWRELPAAYGAWLSIYRAYQRWAATGLWPRILQALQEGETDG